MVLLCDAQYSRGPRCTTGLRRDYATQPVLTDQILRYHQEESLRGLPKKEYPHKPGEFQYGAPNECPKPGAAGFGLEVLPKWLDLSMREEKIEYESLWRLSRSRPLPPYALVLYCIAMVPRAC